MHTIILPYFCEEEIDRYELILDHMIQLGTPSVPFQFLLAASPKTEPSDRLMAAASKVGPAVQFQCPSQVFGYPQGPSAMYWDCMDYVAENVDRGDKTPFALWLESDMVPVQPDWLDRLDQHWNDCGDVLVMGCVVPQINRHRRKLAMPWRRDFQHRQWVQQHVNGGACYRVDMVEHMPADHREGLFDERLGRILAEQGGYADTPAICFSTTDRLATDRKNTDKVLLHGYLQDKNEFLRRCMMPVEALSTLASDQASGGIFGRKQHHAKPKLDAVLSVKDRQPSVLTVFRRKAERRVA